jgi:uncharacterized protein YajQ (UPF0234 family)
MPSFDVVSEVESHEVDNAVQQAAKEVGQRYDFRGTDTTIERSQEGITIKSNSEGRVAAALGVLQEKIARRKIPVGVLDPQKAQPSAGGTVKQLVKIQEGIAQDKAKEIVKLLKGTKIKIQSSIQGESVRVSGKKRDDLQAAIAFLKEQDLGQPLQYTNFRD